MNNLFALADNETINGSVFYLNSIFGTVGNVLGGSGPQLLGTMFQVFNTSILALGSLIVTYTTVMSILMTAHEGEALGKKFHTLWIPIRTVMGIAALVPTSSGYSYLQIGLMWLIIQGIGAADTLWTSTVKYIASGQSTAPAAPGGSSTMLQTQFALLWQGLVCQAASKASYDKGYFCHEYPADDFCKSSDTLSVTATSFQVRNNHYQMGPGPGACGDLQLGDSSDVGQAKTQAFAQIISTLGSLASQFVALDYGYSAFVSEAATSPPPAWIVQYCSDKNLSGTQCNKGQFTGYPSPAPDNKDKSATTVTNLYWPYGLKTIAGGNFLLTAANLYTGIVGAAIDASKSSSTTQPWLAAAVANGWIYAGGYFYYFAKANHQVSSNTDTIKVDPPSLNKLVSSTQTSLTYASQTLTEFIIKEAQDSSQAGSTVMGTNAMNCGGPLNFACQQIIGSWISNLSSSSGPGLSKNPVIAAQSEGNTILTVVEVMIPIIFFFNVAAGFAGGIYLGTGPGVAAAITMVNSLIPVATFIILVFLGLGVTLAVYTPMIPYMLFTFGALNWMIGTIETMIAAPLVAIGLLYPEGHELWGNAEKALMLILNIFLRPSLMIFGMIGGMLMSYTVVMMINFAFLNVVAVVSNGGANVIEMIFFMVLYTSLFTTSMNKCFDLIHVVPDKIMRWIGGGGEQFGEGGGLEKVGQSMEAGGQKAGEFTKDAGAGMGKLAGQKGKVKGAEMARKERQEGRAGEKGSVSQTRDRNKGR